jgi:hypothetical protein
VHHADGEVKFWIEPTIALERNHGLATRQLRTIERLIREHEHEIRKAWQDHFAR